jgi:GxxExxY protein
MSFAPKQAHKELHPKLNKITSEIINAAMAVHLVLGPGLLESAYQVCLIHELRKRGMHIEAEVPVPVIYDGIKLECGYRIDIVVENSVVLELKAIEAIAPIHEAQLISYIKLSGNRLGLLINFHVLHLRDGIMRRVV